MNELSKKTNIQQISFEEKLVEFEVTASEKQKIISSKTNKAIRETVLDVLPFGGIANKILNYAEEINKAFLERKKEILLNAYFEKADNIEVAIINLKKFLSNPFGISLFVKIQRIVEGVPLDEDREFINKLSIALKFIIFSNFESLFEEHTYALNQLESLTIHSITILADYKSWPSFSTGTYKAEGKNQRLTTEWYAQFAEAYAKSKHISDEKKIIRLGFSIKDLINKGYIEAQASPMKVIIKDIGKILLPYITNEN